MGRIDYSLSWKSAGLMLTSFFIYGKLILKMSEEGKKDVLRKRLYSGGFCTCG